MISLDSKQQSDSLPISDLSVLSFSNSMIINLIKKIYENCIGCAFILLLNILGCFWRMARTDDWDPRSWNHYPCVLVPG